MMRKNIFDILENSFDLEAEIGRIHRLFELEKLYRVGRRSLYTIREYVEAFCFTKWKNRGHCIDFSDFLTTVEYSECYQRADREQDCLLRYIEIVYNSLELAVQNGIIPFVDPEDHQLIQLLRITLDDCLARYNCKAVYFEDKEQLIVIEDKPGVTAVAEIVPVELAYGILQYNHFLLKGDIASKKQILLALGNDLESKRVEIKKADDQLCSDIFFMLNNMNLRHNNCVPGTPKYKATVDALNDTEMELWYDELYQMILLAYLKLDHEQRKIKINHLKDCINGGTLL